VKLATHKTVEASREPLSLLAINGGSSSIRFSVYEAGETLRRSLDGKVDHIGLSGTSIALSAAQAKACFPPLNCFTSSGWHSWQVSAVGIRTLFTSAADVCASQWQAEQSMPHWLCLLASGLRACQIITVPL
jgi:hypothetical protein